MYKKYLKILIGELLATFIFMFFAIGSVSVAISFNSVINELDLIIIALGAGLGVFISMSSFKNISEAHLNPAVTISMLISSKMNLLQSTIYIIAQLLGSIIAVAFLYYFVWFSLGKGVGVHSIALEINLFDGLIIETILTFILVFSILVTKKNNKTFLPFTVSLIVIMGQLIAVPLTGGSMNPARSFGPALVSWEWTNHWIYWCGPIFGGIIATSIYMLVFGSEEERKLLGIIKLK